jgi:hypothetical protein
MGCRAASAFGDLRLRCLNSRRRDLIAFLTRSAASPVWGDSIDCGRTLDRGCGKDDADKGRRAAHPESRAKQTIATATEGTASAMSPVGEQRTFHDADEVRFDVSARFRPKAALVQTGSGNPATAAV